MLRINHLNTRIILLPAIGRGSLLGCLPCLSQPCSRLHYNLSPRLSAGVLHRKFSAFPYCRQQWQHQHQSESSGSTSIIRPILWTAAFTACAFYATTEALVYNALRPQPPISEGNKALDPCKVRPLSEIIGNTSAELVGTLITWWIARNAREAVKSDANEGALSISAIYSSIVASASTAFMAFKKQCTTLTRGEYHVYAILALNTAVFFMWCLKRLVPFMKRHFVHDPCSTRSYTLLTSIVSHREYWHYFISSTMLTTLGSHMSDMRSLEHFTFSYVATGALANLASHLAMVLYRRVTLVPLIGAGSAICGLLSVLTRTSKPKWLLPFVYSPFLVALALQGFPQIIGLYRPRSKAGWRSAIYISHVAGAVLGVAYAQWGANQWVKRARARRNKHLAAKSNK